MGQKVHPIGIRLGITKEWSSKWYADTQTYPGYVAQDHLVREFLKKKLKDASVSRRRSARTSRFIRHAPAS
jgi:small subunit ribosomal protein S3